jgi:hypothetical protein
VNARGSFGGKPAPGPFHCLGCKGYVTGTESGHCPRCGYVPPVAVEIPDAAPTRWPRHVGIAGLAILIIAVARLV